MTLFIESQYFPPVKSYSALIKSTNVNISSYENYQRRSFRNRCILSGANGLISLTVPVAGGRNQKNVFSEVRIDYSTDWQQQHWRTIFSAYGKSPWFFHHADSLEKLYVQKVDLLMEWNQICLNWVNNALGVKMNLLQSGRTLGESGDFWKVEGPLESPGTLGESGDFWKVEGPLESPGTLGESGDFWKVEGPLESPGTLGGSGHLWKVERVLDNSGEIENTEPIPDHRDKDPKPEPVLMDWRNRFLPANFQDPELGPFPVYTQVFADRFGFQPNLSILDFVLCCGKGQTDKLRI